MKIKLAIFLSGFVLLFTACDSKPHKAQEITQSITKKEKKEISQIKKYTLTTTTGKKITFEVSNNVMFSKELNGKVVMLNFWAPWCKPCIKEMPSFVKLQEKYKDDFIIIGVLFDKKTSSKELDAFLRKYNVNFPITVGEENFKLAKAFDDIKMIPESFLYSKDGFFIEKFIGEISESKLEDYIKVNIK